MDSATNSLFSRINPDKENSDIFTETVEIYKLREEIIARLTLLEENDFGLFWWQDLKIMEIFKMLFESGIILLPRNPVERLRWIALLCIEMSNYQEFDCGNVVLPLDFLPDEMLEIFEDCYTLGIVTDVKDIRKRLTELGWNAVFGWK